MLELTNYTIRILYALLQILSEQTIRNFRSDNNVKGRKFYISNKGIISGYDSTYPVKNTMCLSYYMQNLFTTLTIFFIIFTWISMKCDDIAGSADGAF